MKKLLLLTTLSSSLLFSSQIAVDSMGLNIGTANSSFDKKDHSGSITLGNEPDESFMSYEVYATLKPMKEICKNKNMKPYLSYTYSSNDDLKHRYILAGINKYYKHDKASLYAGALLGYGQLDWKYDPANTSKNINADANSFMIGAQVGFDYPINSNISLGLNGKYLLSNYETKLNPSAGVSSTIEHKNISSLSFGISYRF